MSPLPSQIGRYEIKSLIGRGGMGDLYLAHDPNTHRLVALKLLNATLDSSELRERFAREARALAALNHPNIVNIYDTGEFEESPFIVMEYVRGETVAEIIKRRAPLSVPQKLKMLAELCAGLAQAHEAGIIHRDIKPANLMVDQKGQLKILDFGIARVAEGSKTHVGLPLTQVNMMIGTPGYMSPEQIEDGEVDHRSDIFAVGAVCYELLSYHEAFSGTNTRQIENKILQGQPTPLAAVAADLDPEIGEVVFRALKRDPNKRYQDAGTFERALERLRSRLGTDASGPPLRPAPPSPANVSGSSRKPRAEAAYQRALVAYQGGALEAARRCAVEALAEDPTHAGARALLVRLNPRSRGAAETSQSASRSAPVPPTAVGTSVSPPASTMASAPTVIVLPGSTGAGARTGATAPAQAAWKRYLALWGSNGPLRKRYEQLWKRERASTKRHEPLWLRYGWAGPALALLLVGVVIVTGVIVFGSWLRPSGQMLTITKPVGGTLSATGIKCGTRGEDCTASRPNGDPIELIPEADPGYAFVGYTGDCAPGGRTIMTTPRTCGATFAPVAAAPIAVTQLLTIAPMPVGGTLEGVDIICGTKGSVCSANHPDGVPVELHPTADAGYTFMGFLGDCAPLGHTQMTSPRTCGATFSRTEAVNQAPPPTVPPAGSRRTPGAPGVGPATTTTTMRPAPTATAGPTVPPLLPDGNKPVVPGGPVPPPISSEQFVKNQIQDILKKFCDAYEAIDPNLVQSVYPSVNMEALKRQLNRTQYKSVQCKFAEPPVFLQVDPEAGTARVQADLKRVYEHNVGSEPPVEQVVTMTLSRPDRRGSWQIETASYKSKPK